MPCSESYALGDPTDDADRPTDRHTYYYRHTYTSAMQPSALNVAHCPK